MNTDKNNNDIDVPEENSEALTDAAAHGDGVPTSDIPTDTNAEAASDRENYVPETVFVSDAADIPAETDSEQTEAPDESAETLTEDTEPVAEDGEAEVGSEEDTENGQPTDESDKTDDSTNVPDGYNPEKPRGIDALFDFVELFIFSLVAVLLVTTFLFRHSVVEGSSMEQTLFENEHLIISNLFYTPARGDIIVCEDYSTALRKPIVKRIIGVEGDRVQVMPTGEVYVNEEKLEEDYVYVDFYVPQREIDVIVPEGEVFVMGDHRNMSTDSREIGTVDMDSILGKVLFRFYPFDKFGKVE